MIVQSDEFEEYRKKSIAREIIMKLAQLSNRIDGNNPLTRISLASSLYGLGKNKLVEDARKENLEQERIFEIFRDSDVECLYKDIFIYLRAWLVCSILFERIMDINMITPNYPNPENPNYSVYQKAIAYIKDRGLDILLNSSELEMCFNNDINKKVIVKEIFAAYLRKLIEYMKKQKIEKI